jgi:hypothetical protein
MASFDNPLYFVDYLSKEIKVYDEPQSPFHRLLECAALSLA